MPKTEELALTPENQAPAIAPAIIPHPLILLERAMQAGLTSENVAVAEKLLQMAREQRAEEAKAAFARDYFLLRKNMPQLHTDKEAKNSRGEVTFTYCSEEEIAKMLEPHLLKYGFATLCGQSQQDGKITIKVTLMHEAGHSEDREFTVRAGSPNAMKDAAMCDSGGATSAWRQLMQKWFGLKSRIVEGQDPHNEGAFIGSDKQQHFKERMADLGGESVNAWFWETAGVGVGQYDRITEGSYPILSRLIEKKLKAKGRV